MWQPGTPTAVPYKCEIVEAGLTLVGSDPYGGVSNAFIKIKAKLGMLPDKKKKGMGKKLNLGNHNEPENYNDLGNYNDDNQEVDY
jgi:hypothetical protein